MRKLRPALACASFAIANLALAAAFAVPVPWSNPSGVQPGQFRWSNGQSDNGLFGSPRPGDYSMTFSPTNFRAISQNGIPQTTTDRLSFQIDIDVTNPHSIKLFEVTALGGDYVIANGGRLTAEMFLFVTNLDEPVGLGNPLTQEANTNPAFPLIEPTQNIAGPWTAALRKEDLPDGWRRINIVLNMTLQANAGAGSTAAIWQNPGDLEISFNIPEPMGASIISSVLLFGAARSRRRRSSPPA